jgi:hypothetical protein
MVALHVNIPPYPASSHARVSDIETDFRVKVPKKPGISNRQTEEFTHVDRLIETSGENNTYGHLHRGSRKIVSPLAIAKRVI